jgi:hypothetical protein
MITNFILKGGCSTGILIDHHYRAKVLITFSYLYQKRFIFTFKMVNLTFNIFPLYS